jgi:hypothetical protein
MALPDEIDWGASSAQRFRVVVKWRKQILGGSYVARVQGARWKLKMNDFPDEPLWSLFIDGRRMADFSDWPPEWTKA